MATYNEHLEEKLELRDEVSSRFRANLATHHLRAAVDAAKRCYATDSANLNASHGLWFEEMMVSVPVAVIMAAAALETNANEIIQDILDRPTELPASDEQLLELQRFKEARTGNTVQKYQKIAESFGRTPHLEGEDWKAARKLVRFRNSFMHFKPAWDDEDDVNNSDLAKYLRERIREVPAFRGEFPVGLMTYECTKWSIETVLTFASMFGGLLGVKDRFSASTFDFSLP